MADYWYNIRGALAKCRDVDAAASWIRRAHEELSSVEFQALLEGVPIWLANHPDVEDLADGVLGILARYDPSGDPTRRSDYALAKVRRAEEESLRQAADTAESERLREEELRVERARRQMRLRLEEDRISEARRSDLLARIKTQLETNFLGADEIARSDASAGAILTHEYEKLKIAFVQDWAVRVLQTRLDGEQAAAVAATEGNILVVARAGSGKTRTLVTRAAFLQNHCGVDPGQLLLLAFNRKAAAEMKSRLRAALSAHLPHVMTFHALAHALVHPDEELVFDDRRADQLGLSREVQEVIDEHIRADHSGACIRQLMMAHFRDDWEQVVAGRFHLEMQELLEYRRALTRQTLGGEYVKSAGERIIANALFEHAVSYRYQRNFRRGTVNYRPDFLVRLRTGGVVIELFGLKGGDDHDPMENKKRRYWTADKDWTLVGCAAEDIVRKGSEEFVQLLVQRLRECGVPCVRLSDDELWNRVRQRAIDNFTSAMTTFIARCRKQNMEPGDLEERIAAHSPVSQAEELFLDVGLSVYRGYLGRLSEQRKEDFDGLLQRAIDLVRGGETRFVRHGGREQGDLRALRYIMIDEFQDFSPMFHRLVDAIRSCNAQVRFFCVGDDWQAINAFAGSDLRFFLGYTEHFNDSRRMLVPTNYRSARGVVGLGNAVMHGLGEAARAHNRDEGWVRLCEMQEFTPTAAERDGHDGDEVTPAVLRIVRHLLDRGLDVVMLSRRNGLPWYIKHDGSGSGGSNGLERLLERIRSYLPEEEHQRVDASTVHGFKGLERDAVILLDAVRGSFPLIHPHWIFLRVFGDSVESLESEERRLFYVALTRARDSLVLLTERPRHSTYLKGICRRTRLNTLEWAELPSVVSPCKPLLRIEVSGETYPSKEQLKNHGFRWDPSSKTWHKAVRAEGFQFDEVLGEPWVAEGVKVRVCSGRGEILHER